MIKFRTILCAFGQHEWIGWHFGTSYPKECWRMCRRCPTIQKRAIDDYGYVHYTTSKADTNDWHDEIRR